MRVQSHMKCPAFNVFKSLLGGDYICGHHFTTAYIVKERQYVAEYITHVEK